MNNDFYILKYAPDGAGAPFFFETDWLPELPEFHYPTENPKGLNHQYTVKAKIDFLDADYLPDQFLASQRFIELCHELSVDAICKKVKIVGLRGDMRGYYFFAPSERISLLDKDNSQFSLEVDKHTGRPAVSSEEDGEFPVYEVIDLFRVAPEVSSHLFFCRELRDVVCSEVFKRKFVQAGMTGGSFEAIDDAFRYAPWEDF